MPVAAGAYLRPALFSAISLDRFDVIRRTEVVDGSGRVVDPAPSQLFENVSGAVGPVSPSDMQRLPDLDLMASTLAVVTTFRLQGPTPGKLPDRVIWPRGGSGNTYQVRAINDYTAYGPGFVQAILQMIDAQTQPPG